MANVIPAAVMAVDAASGTATVGFDGARHEVSVELLDSVSVGDYVLVDVGFAVAKISTAEADRTLARIVDGVCDPAAADTPAAA